MNGLLLLGIAAVLFICAYVFYGRYLVKTWGIDVNADTPAKTYEDGEDFVPSNKWKVFAHQFSSIAGAGPVTGPVMALMFGWLPAVLWIVIGGIFFGAVHDFGALYASVKSKGQSMGKIVEDNIGKTGKKLFFLFCWLFSLIVIAAFADMVSGTFNGFNAQTGAKAVANGSAASISIFYVFGAILFGYITRKLDVKGWKQVVLGIVFVVVMLALGIKFPVFLGKQAWTYIVFVYIFFAAITPIALMKQPRDYLTTFLFVGMIVAAMLGIVVSNPTITTPAFTGFKTQTGSYLFPTLFVTIACGAVSGFHSLVSSETSSKQIANEKDMLQVGYGSMLLESMLAIVVIVVVGSLPSLAHSGVLNNALSSVALADTATPFQKFATGVTGLLDQLGMPQAWGLCIMTMFVSALALTTLDAVARIARMSLQELLEPTEGEASSVVKFITNKYVATFITLLGGYLLSLGGYQNIWPLFGATNQLLAAMTLITLAVFMKVTGRKGFMLYIPMVIMFTVTVSSLCLSIYNIVLKLFVTGGFVFMTDGLQLLFAILLLALGCMVAFKSGKKLKEVPSHGSSQMAFKAQDKAE